MPYNNIASVPTRPLGTNGPQVPRMGFGLMGLSHSRSAVPLPDEERLALLDHAHEIGARFWDTSDFYGDNEDLIGKWFAKGGKREDIFLATKFGGILIPSEQGIKYEFRGDVEYVPIAIEQSLKRLGVDYVDLWYPHRLNGSTPIEHIVAAMVKVKEQGKIRHIGLVEVSAETLRRAHAVHPISCVQVEYSPFSMDIEDPKIRLLETCRELGVAVVCYSPLSRGLLTGQLKSHDDFEEGDVRKFFPRFSAENFPKNLVLVDAMKELAREKGCTAGQLSLAWLLAQGDDIFPIPGTVRIKNLDENMAAANVELTPEETAKIRELVNNATAYGTRYPDDMNPFPFADTPPLSS